MKLPRIMALFLLVLMLVMLAPVQPVEGVQQAGLDSGGDAAEVNHDNLGNLYVSDFTAEKIWQIKASDGSYKAYSLGHTVRDAQMDSNNRIWWVDDADSFGYVIPDNHYGIRWTLSSDTFNFIHTLVPDGQGGIWLGESLSSGRLFHFNITNRQLCQYELPGGAFTYDMDYQSGYLWVGNWNAAQFYRILPDYGNNSISYVYWQEDYSGGAWGVDFDGKYLWWADFYLGAIGRLDPDQDLATYYHLPIGDQPIMIELAKGMVWYTEQFGQVGMLNPSVAAGDDVLLGWESGSVQAACTYLDTLDYPYVDITSGTFSWDDSPVSNVYTSAGWKIFELPDSSPFGLSVSGDRVWVSDYGRDLLLRFETETILPIYLPLIYKN